MTHEFKTPISTISLAAQMLKDPAVAKSPQMFQHISGVINDETKRLRFQVEKVLQMSMFERQKTMMKLNTVDVNGIITSVMSTFKLKVEKYGGTIEADLEAEDAWVKVDEMHFTDVIFNLLDNAVKFSSDNSSITLETTVNHGKVFVSVKDHGTGIPKESLSRIWDRFYKIDASRGKDRKGTGLGLAIVKEIINAHKQNINVISTVGVGTEFIFTLEKSK